MASFVAALEVREQLGILRRRGDDLQLVIACIAWSDDGFILKPVFDGQGMMRASVISKQLPQFSEVDVFGLHVPAKSTLPELSEIAPPRRKAKIGGRSDRVTVGSRKEEEDIARLKLRH